MENIEGFELSVSSVDVVLMSRKGFGAQGVLNGYRPWYGLDYK